MIEIRNRHGVALYSSESATTLLEAVQEAARKDINLQGADLRGADLAVLELCGIILDDADLTDVDFSGSRLCGARLLGAQLKGADFHMADLTGAVLDEKDGITFDAGPSGRGHMLRLDADGYFDPNGEWRITIGCWQDKSLEDLRDLIEDKVNWPEAEGPERERRRPYLRAILALCEAHINYQEGR